jgi:hypothetical protein
MLDELREMGPDESMVGKTVVKWERVTIKEVVNTALEEAILKYEKKNGDIKTTPKK